MGEAHEVLLRETRNAGGLQGKDRRARGPQLRPLGVSLREPFRRKGQSPGLGQSTNLMDTRAEPIEKILAHLRQEGIDASYYALSISHRAPGGGG